MKTFLLSSATGCRAIEKSGVRFPEAILAKHREEAAE